VRFLIDSCSGRKVANALKAAGHDVVYIPDSGSDPGDEAMLERASQEERILVTMDADFGRLVFLLAKPHSGVIRLRPMRPSQRVAAILSVVSELDETALTTTMVTVDSDRYRIRRS
jgi:predicted nuclease of predicted toxin-antitoxin system